MNLAEELTKLNPAQLAAVTADPSNLLILAGAGSGKTKVLVNRIAWLMQNHAIGSHNILAVTFTNKAAHEMLERLASLLNMPATNMWVGTFHGLAHRLLRRHAREANLAEDFQIMDASDQLHFVKQIHKKLNLVEEMWPAKKSMWFINQCKNEGFRPSNLPASRDFTNPQLAEVYRIYQQSCQANNIVDFGDLLLASYELLRDNETISNHYRQRFQHILVDEFQDTNNIQYLWLKTLLHADNKLLVVGDDDQSIYGWRGARVENMHKIAKEVPAMNIIRLEQNYRSTANILQAANAIISNNANRLGKQLHTTAGQGELITYYAAYNENDEAEFVVKQAEKYLQQGFTAQEIAVLYRSNAQSRILEEVFTRKSVPYQIYGGLRFFERAEIKDALAYLRLMVNRHDDQAFSRIVNVPTRGIGPATLAAISEYGQQQNKSLWQSALDLLAVEALKPHAINALQSFITLINTIYDDIQHLGLAQQIDQVLVSSGLFGHYKEDKSELGQMRVENLMELVTAATAEEEGTTLNIFLGKLALDTYDENESKDGKQGVQLMTLHSAKGLEFPVVFMIGMEQGLFPHQLSLNEPSGIEEERRLCYVGMTRAKQKLFVTYAKKRRVKQAYLDRKESKFLTEIPSNLLVAANQVRVYEPVFHSSNANYRYKGGTSAFVQSNSYSNGGEARASKGGSAAGISSQHNHLGKTVVHSKFGEGTVIDYSGANEQLLVQIKFANGSIKWLLANHPSLKLR